MVDAAIADDLIVGMLCGEGENERRSGTLSFFEKGCEGGVYNVAVQKASKFVLCRRIVAAGVSFHVTSRILRYVSDVTWVSQVSRGISNLKLLLIFVLLLSLHFRRFLMFSALAGLFPLRSMSLPPTQLATLTSC
jgi:hypothetical protein